MNNELTSTIEAVISENTMTSGMGTDRCWIATVRSLVGILTGATVAQIDEALVAGHRAGTWTMSRCDLVSAAPVGAVQKSEISNGFATWHFVRIGR